MKEEVGGGEKKGKGVVQSVPQGESTPILGPLSSGFYFFLAGRNFREGLRGRFQQNNQQFSRCPLSGPWSPLIGK